jgi:hypothetical protein
MNDAQIIEAAAKYAKLLKGYEPKRRNPEKHKANKKQSCRHAAWMCQEIPVFISEGKRDKAMRWLCFVQAILWRSGLVSIVELREDNRSSQPPSND